MIRKTVSGIILALLLAGMLILTFGIHPAKASGTIYIRADGSVDPDTASISSVDNITYTFTNNLYDSIVVERDNITIDGNGFLLEGAGSAYGIALSGRMHVTIKNALIENFGYGIRLSGSLGTTLSKNSLVSNTYYGIGLDLYSNNNIITGNSISNNLGGIGLGDSSNNIITGNNVIANDVYAIHFWSSSHNNIITRNDIKDNEYGISLYESSGNELFHNNFINNNNQVDSWNSMNVWDHDYPTGGNYWSDYTGVDLYGGPNQDYPSGSDGLGDSPYVIDESNQDRYPLTSPWIERTVGVKPGDWARYKYEFTWSSTDPNEQPPQDLVDFVTHLEWYGINVLEVFDTTIVFQTVIHFKNSTEIKSQWTVDINNGSGNGTYLIDFIAAGLNPNHRLCAPAPGQFTWCGWQIEETISRPYMGVVRETNHLNVTDWSFTGRYLPLEFDSVDDFYWDRATGIICEEAHQQNYESGGYVTSLSLIGKIFATNIWKIPFPHDLNKDGVVDIKDLAQAGLSFGTYISHPKWNPIADLNQDGKVDIRDLVLIARNFGKTYP